MKEWLLEICKFIAIAICRRQFKAQFQVLKYKLIDTWSRCATNFKVSETAIIIQCKSNSQA